MATLEWEVVGGLVAGGIVVCIGQSVDSEQCPERLSVGSVIQERELVGNRLRFAKLRGQGPNTGWVTVRFSGRDMCIRRVELTSAAAAAIAAAAEPLDLSLEPDLPATTQVFDVGTECELYVHDSASASTYHAACGDSDKESEQALRVGNVVNFVDLCLAAKEQQNTNIGSAVSGVTCFKCKGCIRPPGHQGECMNEVGELRPMPKLGLYVGRVVNASFANEEVSYQVLLLEVRCSIQRIPKESFMQGGMPAWQCEGYWAFNGVDVMVSVDAPDLSGPKEGEQLSLVAAKSGDKLTFHGVQCCWRQGRTKAQVEADAQEAFRRKEAEEQREMIAAQELAEAAQAEQSRRAAALELRRQAEEELERTRRLEDEKRRAEALRAAERQMDERRSRAAEEEAERCRQAEAEAAENERREAAGETHVTVYINRMLKIKVDFWQPEGTTFNQTKAIGDTALRSKFPAINLTALRLQRCGYDEALVDTDILSGPSVELEHCQD